MTTTGFPADAGVIDPPPGEPTADGAAGRPASWRRFLRGPAEDPAWARPALAALLVATAVLYLVDLNASGYANSFYGAAAQAASTSWKAMLFGSFDAAGFITVDKPPAFLWVMGLSGRVFGFSSWSMLVPQALEGVATVGLLFGAVRRWHGPGAGLLAGAILALTPSAALIFRFNNPDALLVLLLVAAAYCVVRALEEGRTGWLLLAGSAVGFGFLAKMLEAFLVLPALALAYLVCAPVTIGRRLVQLVGSLVALLVSAGWWVAVVELTPRADRPYVGGSTNDNVLSLAFGYNGLGRVFGGQGNPGGSGGVGGGGRGGGALFGGSTGLGRLFTGEFGNEISWLLPAALVALAGGFVVLRGSGGRTGRPRASLVVWGGWLVVTALTFSYMKGIIHPYYTVALAPPVAGSVAAGGQVLWSRRDRLEARIWLALVVLAAAVWSFVLLHRDASWHPEVRYAVVVLGVLAAAALVLPVRVLTRAAGVVVAVGTVAGLTGTAAYAVATAATPHTGSIPSVGPSSAASSAGGFGGRGGGAGFADRSGRRGPAQGEGQGRNSGFPGNVPANSPLPEGVPGGSLPGAVPDFPGGPPGAVPDFPGGGFPGGGFPGGGAGGPGGGGSGPTAGASTNSALVALLQRAGTKWAAAASGSMSAAPLQLASGQPVMSMGGFDGSDPAPTLAQFKAYVAAGDVHYYVGGGGFGGGGFGGGGRGGGGRGDSGDIASWVEANYTASTVGGTTVYDLTRPKAASAASSSTSG